MSKKIKIGITGVNPFNGNRGVGALAYSTIYLLNEIAKERKLHLELYIISHNQDEYTIDFVDEQIKINNISPFTLSKLTDWAKLILKPSKLKSVLRYQSLNYVLSMGEGDSLSDIYGKERFNYIDGQHKLARLFNKKHALLPQTIGPFTNTQIKKAAIKSIEKAQLVFARDLQSYDFVKENTIQENVFEITDVAFFMPFKKQKFSEKQIHVGLNISALLWNGGYTRNNQFGLKTDYQELTKKIIDYFLSIPNVIIHIVPHVVLANKDIENDYEVSYHLVNEYANKRIVLAPFFLTPILAKNYIAGLDFFAGARMHATIAAFSSGVPVFPLAYSRKFNGLFADTLSYQYLGDMVKHDIDSILDRLKEAFENKNKLKSIIEKNMNSVIRDRKNLFGEKLATFFSI